MGFGHEHYIEEPRGMRHVHIFRAIVPNQIGVRVTRTGYMLTKEWTWTCERIREITLVFNIEYDILDNCPLC